MAKSSRPEKESNNEITFNRSYYMDIENINRRFKNVNDSIEYEKKRFLNEIQKVLILIFVILVGSSWIIANALEKSELNSLNVTNIVKKQLEEHILKQKDYFEKYIHVMVDVLLNSVEFDENRSVKFDFDRCRTLYPLYNRKLIGNMCDNVQSIFDHNITRCKPNNQKCPDAVVCDGNVGYCDGIPKMRIPDLYSLEFLKKPINSTFGYHCRFNGGCTPSPLFIDRCEESKKRIIESDKKDVEKTIIIEPEKPKESSNIHTTMRDDEVDWCALLDKPSGQAERLYQKHGVWTNENGIKSEINQNKKVLENYYLVGGNDRFYWRNEIMHKCCISQMKEGNYCDEVYYHLF